MKKVLIVALAVLMALGLSGMAMAGDVDVTTVGSVDAGYVDIDGMSYSGGNLGAHHSFDAWGSFNFDVDFLSADSGNGNSGDGLGNLDMNIHQAESTSYAGFQAVWRQDFDVTSNYKYTAGVVGLYAEGTGGATMNLPQGNAPYFSNIGVPSGYAGSELSAEGTIPIPGTNDPTSPAYIVQSWVESYTNYSDISDDDDPNTLPNSPTDWSSINVKGTGGKATMDFGGSWGDSGKRFDVAYAGHSGVKHGCWKSPSPTNGVNVDFGSGTYSRSVGGDNYVAWEGGTANNGGSGGMGFNYNDGYHADPWTKAN